MHVSNLGYAVKLLRAWASGKGTLSPFCTWIGDAKLQIATAMEHSGMMDTGGHLLAEYSELDGIAAVLLLVALRNKIPSNSETLSDGKAG